MGTVKVIFEILIVAFCCGVLIFFSFFIPDDGRFPYEYSQDEINRKVKERKIETHMKKDIKEYPGRE